MWLNLILSSLRQIIIACATTFILFHLGLCLSLILLLRPNVSQSHLVRLLDVGRQVGVAHVGRVAPADSDGSLFKIWEYCMS